MIRKSPRRYRIGFLLLAAVVSLSACVRPASQATPTPAAPRAAETVATDNAPAGTAQSLAPRVAGNVVVSTVETKEAPRVDYVGKMSISPNHGVAGTRTTVTGSGLPANTRLELRWYTVDGSWDLRGELQESYFGRKFEPTSWLLDTITTDAGGNFEHTFTVPLDFGFWHDVAVVQDGVIRNKAAFNVDMEATIYPTSGPVGTPITIDIKGLGSGTYDNFWKVFWDNKDAGFLSATTTRGHARAVIPAVGKPGKHIIQIIEGAFTFSYRNIQESPFPWLKPFAFEFEVTEGEPILPPPLKEQSLPVVAGTEPPGTGAAIWGDVVSGPVGTPITLQGRGLPASQQVKLIWHTVKGNRVSGTGWEDVPRDLATVTTDARGAFTYRFNALDDLGGRRPITAWVGDKAVARTEFLLQPSAIQIEPTAGPVGTDIHIQVKGVGWTETANIYTVVYDNAYIGYVCGFTTQGTVNIYLKATGDPGWHFIDLYPSIYKGQEPLGSTTFRMPQLTYAADHPGERLPALRFAFQVTE